MSEEKLLYCSFCGKSQNEAEQLVTGDDCCICNFCIEGCRDIIGQARMKKEEVEIVKKDSK